MALCSQAFTLSVVEEDMPLDQAVYANSPAAGGAFIFGVRGGYLFKFNATTGVKITTSRFRTPCFGDSSLAYDAVTDSLIVSCWNDKWDWDNFVAPVKSSPGFRAIYKIDPGTLTVAASLDITVAFGTGSSYQFGGPHSIIAANNLIYGSWNDSTATRPTRLFRYNPSTNTATSWANSNLTTSHYDLEYDGVSRLVVADGFSSDGPYWVSATNTADNLHFIYTPTANPMGLCLIPASGLFYSSTGTDTILKFSIAAGNLGTLTLPSASAVPYKIRRNPYNGLVYVPSYSAATNAVYIFDPANEGAGFTTKTGFDAPFDVIFTPTKQFAVQHGSTGLKEIV